MDIGQCRKIGLQSIRDQRGQLVVAEVERQISFPVRRVFYVCGVPGGKVRGEHAHKRLEQLILAPYGRFEVLLDDGVDKRVDVLDDPGTGLYIPPLIWHEMRGFSEGAVCLVLASDRYDESDYYRDYAAFLGAAGGKR
ncbi:MAG: FdtA/QdtA family cupin domain-containing protein [Elusimicrobia bacterium]|nr:FdtA/QdtA family cupin domain-containing protein [Elusimicrobiota bacterium]